MGDTKIQIHDDYCKNISPKEISDILDRLSAIISASYTRPIGDTEDEEAKSAYPGRVLPHLCAMQ